MKAEPAGGRESPIWLLALEPSGGCDRGQDHPRLTAGRKPCPSTDLADNTSDELRETIKPMLPPEPTIKPMLPPEPTKPKGGRPRAAE